MEEGGAAGAAMDENVVAVALSGDQAGAFEGCEVVGDGIGLSSRCRPAVLLVLGCPLPMA